MNREEAITLRCDHSLNQQEFEVRYSDLEDDYLVLSWRDLCEWTDEELETLSSLNVGDMVEIPAHGKVTRIV